jgi:propanediol dehydratase small subunit
MSTHDIHTRTGRSLNELTLEAVLDGTVGVADFSISAEQLRRQAEESERAGYPQLAESLRRAAELTALSNEEILALYDALRPGRATYEELLALAERLERENDAHGTAALIREAADVYRARGIAKDGTGTRAQSM